MVLASALAEAFLPWAREILDPQVLVPALAVAALVREGEGDPRGTVALIEELGRAGEDAADWTRMLFLQTAVRLVVRAGRPDLGRQLLHGVQADNGRERNSLLTSQAIMAAARDDLDEASAANLEAADRWGEYGFSLERGWALLGAGRALIARGSTEDGQAALSKAGETFGRLGAVRLMAETDALLREEPKPVR